MWTLLLTCFLWPLHVMADRMDAPPSQPDGEDLPVVEVKADRTNIYPQRMKLTGEESLLDVLLMCPDLMVAGYEDLISSYNLRLDNVAMNGDTRLILSQMKAKDIAKIQVCDNTGVAKGTVGLNRVMDINMRKYDEGTEGFIEARGEMPVHNRDGYKHPSAMGTANLLMGSKKTDVYANVSYRYKELSREHLTLHMTNRLTDRDKLLTYFTQSFVEPDLHTFGAQKYLGRARYFHTFNDIGTELLLLGSYQYATDATIRNNAPMWLAELNTPFLNKNLSMMLGAEGDYSATRVKKMGRSYVANNHDVYLQYTLSLDQWRFTVGDRVMMYHYSVQQDGEDKRMHNRTGNNMNAVAIFVPEQHHQFQLGYYKKFINPSYKTYFEQMPTLSDEEWAITRGGLKDQDVNQYKLAYAYSKKAMTIQSEVSYTDVCGDNNFFNWNTSAYWRGDIQDVDVALTGGLNFYASKDGGYAALRLAPKLYLPEQWQVGVQLVGYTSKAPRRTQTGVPVYGCVTANKQLGSHWDFGLEWHDMFDLLKSRKENVENRNAVMGRVQYRF